MANALKTMAVLVIGSAGLLAAPPDGWFMAGSKPADYESNVDKTVVYNGRPSASLASKKPSIEGFGTLMQSFSADKYVGQRVRFSAFVKSSGVADWSGLWMRVDGAGSPPKMLAFDNMQSRAIKGTTEWMNYEVVLDVPEGAKGIFFGILLSGTGTVWLNSSNFEVVGTGIATTGKLPKTPDGPANLGFDK